MNYSQSSRWKSNILVVDDTRESLRLLEDILKKQGYTVRPIPEGHLALKAAQANPPDLILLDINMPGMSGYDVCEQLKADARTADIPIIFISALDDTTDKVKAFTLGGVDYITKPFYVEEVLARVATHVALQKLEQDLEEKNVQLQQEIYRRKQVEEELQTCRELVRNS
ncbi:MAG: response regulator [bacterium]|nr:response regulator [bacterium]